MHLALEWKDVSNVKNDLISVIVPVYNTELYLSRCIDSIIDQTYKNLEIILVDDGSTDHSGEICDSYAEKDKRIQVIHKENGGTASARNRGLEIARGEYVGFVDSDDYVAEDMYQTLVEYMQPDIDIICCGRVCILPRGKEKRYCINKAEIFSREEALEELILLRKMSTSVCTSLYRRSLFQDIWFPQGVVNEDVSAQYELYKKARKVCHVGRAKYFNYHRGDSKSNGDFYMKRIDYLLQKRDICIDVGNKFPKLIKQAEAGYMQAALYIVGNIETSADRDKYSNIEKRVRKLVRNMMLRSLRNPFLDKVTKKKLVKAGFEYC